MTPRDTNSPIIRNPPRHAPVDPLPPGAVVHRDANPPDDTPEPETTEEILLLRRIAASLDILCGSPANPPATD